MVTRVLKSFEIGQPFSAASVALRNASSDAPGTLALSSRWDSVMFHEPPTFSSVIVQVVASSVATRLALPSSADTAIVKQLACAAAASSSGLLPFSSPNRFVQE